MTLPYDIYPLVMKAITLFSEGRSKTRACDDAGITIAVFDNYIKNNEAMAELYREAEQRSYDALADALLEIDNHAIYGQSDSKMANVMSGNIKWVLEKRDSKRFGQRLTVDHNVTMDRAIISALTEGRKRAALGHDATVIDVTPQLSEEDEIAALCSF